MIKEPNTILYINPINCVGCSKCKQTCPNHAIIGVKNKPHKITRQCVQCKLCVNVCPKSCINIKSTTSILPKTSKPAHFISELDNDPETIAAKKHYIDNILKELEQKNNVH